MHIALAFLLLIAADQDPGTKFAVAIEDHDVDAVKALLQSGLSTETPIDYGEHQITPLVKAAWDGDEEIVKTLIAAGAKVNAKATDTGETALINAVSNKNKAIAEMLLAAGADVSIKNRFDFNALNIAVAAGPADGSMVVGGKATPLRHAYAVEKNTLLKVIVSQEPIDDPLNADDFTGVAVQLDEKKKAEEVFFFHPKLPAGLSVRQLSRFEPKTLTAKRVAGRLVLDDPGNSFTYDVTFDAPVVHAKESIETLAADAPKEQHA